MIVGPALRLLLPFALSALQQRAREPESIDLLTVSRFRTVVVCGKRGWGKSILSRGLAIVAHAFDGLAVRVSERGRLLEQPASVGVEETYYVLDDMPVTPKRDVKLADLLQRARPDQDRTDSGRFAIVAPLLRAMPCDAIAYADAILLGGYRGDDWRQERDEWREVVREACDLGCPERSFLVRVDGGWRRLGVPELAR